MEACGLSQNIPLNIFIWLYWIYYCWIILDILMLPISMYMYLYLINSAENQDSPYGYNDNLTEPQSMRILCSYKTTTESRMQRTLGAIA
jgi:hypothetical protein